MAKALSELPIGALVKDEGTTYLDKPIIWKIAAKEFMYYPEHSVTLMTEYAFTEIYFDAREPTSDDVDRRRSGNGRYLHSNVRQWLNSEAAAGEWYAPQHETDAPPTRSNSNQNFSVSENPGYEQKAGFMNGFSNFFKEALIPTELETPDFQGTDITVDKIFLLSDQEAFEISAKFEPMYSLETRKYLSMCFLRSISGQSRVFAIYLDSRQPIGWKTLSISAFGGNVGTRPLCNIPDTILVSDEPDTDGAYIIEWEEPPAAPLNITIPEKILGGEGIAISWNASPDDDIVGYILERQYNDGDWEELYDGAAFSHTDTIAFGWNSIAYRVCAYRGSGAKSSYLTSETRTVRNNTAPVINVITEPSSTPTAAFDIAYMVTDEDAEITVTESIDGSEKHKFTAADGQSNTFSITQEDWIKLANGVHTLKITAEDTDGAVAEYAYTFTKNETQIEFMLATAQAVKEMPIGLRLVIQRKIPTGAVFQVEVCNNGFDDAPTWEDATNAAMRGEQYLFVNSHKSAENWALNVKLTIDRNGATGDCYISSIRGYYETEV